MTLLIMGDPVEKVPEDGWEKTWAALEALPPEEQNAPQTIRLRLYCAIGLERWNTVRELAEHLAQGDDEDRWAASGGFRVLAGVATRAREIEAAKVLVLSAVEAWPEVRQEIADDPELVQHLP
ncbi:hypothetical protein OKA04_09065 [Luteolibacter flavescens]|uniref:HEAT repeat domain-containing protein n=1 Tax=Luteolibacter flavescens TaxID=1859460 RepID=A0ABT3FMS6_9BACT|nr:hypothetical protein [Luteolibacter flavescens]MCW1884877.1 hypothetical protein [Luteolibacter flavescens]